MPLFKFRAECMYDINQLKEKLSNKDVLIAHRIDDLPDAVAILNTTMSLEEVMNIIRGIEDSHVMLQTISPYRLYTGKRDYSIR